MANRRMFSIQVVESDAFKDLPFSTQALYLHLSMNADDDGFVNSPKSIVRGIGAKSSDLETLVKAHFVIMFESGVLVIKHWKLNNYIQSDRYKTTSYIEEKALLEEKENRVYTLMDTEHGYTSTDTQIRIDKNREEENRRDKQKSSIKELVEGYSNNFQMVEDLYAFIEMRKKMKAPMTEQAVKIALNKLSSLTQDEEEAIKIIEQSIEHGWKSFYPLKEDKPKTRQEELHQLYEKYKKEEEESGQKRHDDPDEFSFSDIFQLESGEF